MTVYCVYACYGDAEAYWAAALAAAYVCMGLPAGLRVIGSLDREKRALIVFLTSVCAGGERLLTVYPQREAHCLRLERGIAEVACLNSTYATLAYAKGRVTNPPAGLQALPRDFTCFRTLVGRWREEDSVRVFEGLMAFPRGGVPLYVKGAMARLELKSLDDAGRALEELRRLVEGSWADGDG